MPTLKELREIAKQKYEIYREIKDQHDKYKYEREAYYREVVRKELDEKFGVTYSRATKEYNEAQNNSNEALNKANEEATLQRISYPEGTVLLEWDHLHGYCTYDNKLTPTGNRGILQIFRSGDLYPQNRKWSLPHHGDLIVRILKKNGTTGIQFNNFDQRYWFPEGINPNWVKVTETKDKELEGMI